MRVIISGAAAAKAVKADGESTRWFIFIAMD